MQEPFEKMQFVSFPTVLFPFRSSLSFALNDRYYIRLKFHYTYADRYF